MRRALTFTCEGATLVGSLDDAADKAGLLIVSGGNEIRSGAHRGMAELAAAIAAKGYPVFRFDRRGVGDSEGDNRGFRFSGPDIIAALDAFRRECPALTHIVAFGNCDAATALALHGTPVDARVLANLWVIPSTGEMPPPAAIKDRYVRRLRDPEAWKALLTGKIDMGKLAKGLGRLAAAKPAQPDSLADKTVRALEASPIPTTILLATGDATAIAFADVWRGDPAVKVERIETASHSFAGESEFGGLVRVLETALSEG
ncbi:hydrolase 1, exosortase A system-associated [Sphingomonas sp. SUN039]|uniref:hydrolase 1, exosortase A system-associated n=1 Tax=Sphingomonas sp. SUN039 TaxID=2937787 RepID=UPI002164D558|nr:hydrolase 1, exosortase A system-associated [Sphingomonas sp. SUN039]UVO53287.1 hydrolase 1, exosortase A system-associated [Sphingomonas sp. SUN039]